MQPIDHWFGLSAPLLALTAVIMLGGGVVRGYSGFGSSAVVIGALAIVISPARIVPMLYMMEIAASLSLLRSSWRHLDWGWLIPLAATNLLVTPLGVWMLARFETRTLQLIVALSLLPLSLLLLSGWSVAPRSRAAGATLRCLTGATSGLMSGVAAIGGISVAAMILLMSEEAVRLRATMIALIALMDTWGLTLACVNGIVGRQTFALFGLMAPAMMLGIQLGHWCFRLDERSIVAESRFRRRVSWLLLSLALAGLAKAVLQ